MIKNFEEKSDFILYVERNNEQKLANLANIYIEDKSNKNTLISTFQDVIFNPHYGCKLRPPTIRFLSPITGCEGCEILCSNAKKIPPKIKVDKTEEYINRFIITEFDKNSYNPELFFELRGGVHSLFNEDVVNWLLVAKAINSLTYVDFLKTYYWYIIARSLKEEAKNRCRLCNSDVDLNVHHRTYETHGYEAQNLQDLIVLCNDCHSTYHNKN